MSPKAFLRRRLPRLQWLRRRQQPKRHFSFERGREEGETLLGDSSSSLARIQNALLNRGKTWHAVPLHCHSSVPASQHSSAWSRRFQLRLPAYFLMHSTAVYLTKYFYLHSTRPTWPTSVKAFSSSPARLPSLCLSIAHSRDRFLVNFQRRAKVILNEPGPRRNCMPSETQGRTDGRTDGRRQTLAAAAARAQVRLRAPERNCGLNLKNEAARGWRPNSHQNE